MTGCGVNAWAVMSAAEDAQDGLDLTGARIISTTERTCTLMCFGMNTPLLMQAHAVQCIPRIADFGRMH